MGKLSLVFLQFAKGRADLPADGKELERLLEHAVNIGRQERRFTLEAELFVEYLAQRLPEASAGVTLAQVLEKIHLRDLYLACACVHKVPEAIAELEDTHLTELRIWLKRTNSVVDVDEVCQSVRIQLLVGLTPAGPRLAKYLGHGSLQNWIRVVASHLLPLRTKPHAGGTPEDNLLDALAKIPGQGPDSETALNKRHIDDVFRKALRDAFAVLTPEQRRLLRFYYLDRLTTIELGKMIGKDQSTASRKLAEAREAVYNETTRLFRERLRLSPTELDSLLAALGSGFFDVSISRILGEPDEEDNEVNKRRIVQEFPQALRDTLAVLSREQRRLLRFYHFDGLTTIEIGKKIGKNQSTASRKLGEAREAVYNETIRLLRERLQLSSTELDSILVALGSGFFDVSISQILGESDDEDDEK